VGDALGGNSPVKPLAPPGGSRMRAKFTSNLRQQFENLVASDRPKDWVSAFLMSQTLQPLHGDSIVLSGERYWGLRALQDGSSWSNASDTAQLVEGIGTLVSWEKRAEFTNNNKEAFFSFSGNSDLDLMFHWIGTQIKDHLNSYDRLINTYRPSRRVLVFLTPAAQSERHSPFMSASIAHGILVAQIKTTRALNGILMVLDSKQDKEIFLKSIHAAHAAYRQALKYINENPLLGLDTLSGRRESVAKAFQRVAPLVYPSSSAPSPTEQTGVYCDAQIEKVLNEQNEDDEIARREQNARAFEETLRSILNKSK
jgi:hypothetical protein